MAAQFPGLASPETDGDDDGSAAVDSIVSQAIDSATLEQIAELNSPSLPASLETRFQRLKSFPAATNSQLRTRSASQADEAEIISSKNPNGEKSQEQKPTYGSSSPSPPSSSTSSVTTYREYSPSPPRAVCCFGCPSPSKRTTKKKKKKNDEILTDLSTFSLKEQQRKLKKVSREAEKVVEWVKQASARMDVSAIDELLHEEEEKHHK